MQPRQMIQRLMNNISTVIVGKQEVIEYALIALLCRGHVLIEDVPGVGKTRSPAPWRNRWTARSGASSSPPT